MTSEKRGGGAMPKAAKPVGRPPTFSGGLSVTRVRLKLSREQWEAIEREAEAQGKSFREFLRMRLRKALSEFLD